MEQGIIYRISVKSCKSFIILQYVHMPIKYNYLINIFFLILKYLA